MRNCLIRFEPGANALRLTADQKHNSKQMSAPYNNQNAKLPEGEAKESLLAIRVTRKRKGAYIRAARPGPLAPWVQHHLDKAANYKETGNK